MAALCRFVRQFGRNILFSESNRSISLSATTHLREIVEKKEGNVLTIEGLLTTDKRDDRLIKTKEGVCRVCSSQLDIKHTDVLILSQFVRSDGCMLPRRITGLCKTQQKRIGTMVAMAQKAGLMPNLAPKNSKMDPRRRLQWKKFNTYFDETTIKHRYL